MIFAEIALFPQQASTTAEQVDMLFLFLFTVCGTVTLVVAFLLAYFSVRYRRRPGEVGNPPETPSSHILEWSWTLAPLGIFVVMFVWGAEVYFAAYRPPADAATIYVVGKQWMWKFQHPEGQREIDMLHVPVGRPIRLLMTSEDVIHSLFIPDFRIHMDLLPGRYTSVWFQASRPGTYHLFCSQYCGTNHAGMTGQVVAMEPADYDQWLHRGAEGSMALEGRKLFLKYRCASCHSADAEARAPVLENLFRRPVALNDGRVVEADESYIRESILAPSAKIVAGYENIMPTFQGQVSEEEICKLIAFIQSLKAGETPRRVESYPPPTTTPPVNTKD
ncbi:MAG: cytochrome c oxidase subunit II [Thermoguttaceae bacterium]|jgi:cytochrome c oxidase subunit 2